MKKIVIFLVSLIGMVSYADVLDELLPRPKKVTRNGDMTKVADLGPTKVITGVIEDAPKHLAIEAYRLQITAKGVIITAPDKRGVRYAQVTLEQLKKLAGEGSVPCCTIEDWPKYRWRGFMPDTARNFLPFPMLKEIVDFMAAYKLNLLHWHLTENYAWRLESKKYPQLQDEKTFLLRHIGKYYTQEEFKELVRYCSERGITIMPEFDVPGHALAFRRAFGFSRMSAVGADKIVAELFDELCTLASKEEMPFVHVGGDEVWKREMEGVSQETLALWSETLAKNNRTLVRWAGPKKTDKKGPPNEEFPVRGPWVGMQWCGHKGTIPTNPIFDANSMYIESMDPFELLPTALFNRICPWENLTEEMKLGAVFCGWHDGFVGEDYANVFRNEQIVPSCLLFGEAFWCGEAADKPSYKRRLPTRDTPEFKAVVDLENRVIAQRDRVLTGLRRPFHFLRQSNLAWRITDATNGRVLAKDQPGATIQPNRGKDNPANFFTNETGVVIMETWIKSPKTQQVGAWIGFTSIDRDHGFIRARPLPKLGEWTRFGSKIEINGEEIAPPKWQRPGLDRGNIIPEMTCWKLYELDEEPFTDQEYFMREPTPIMLNEGWNHVKLTLPMTATGGRGWWTVQWVGTFIPLLGTTDHPREVPDLEYSSEPHECIEKKQISKSFSSFGPSQVVVEGEIGTRMRLTIEKMLKHTDIERTFVRHFRNRKEKPEEPGGFAGYGMFLDALVKAAAHGIGGEETIQAKTKLLKELSELQSADGRITMFSGKPGFWDNHEGAYMIQALCLDHRWFGTKSSLETAKRLADSLIRDKAFTTLGSETAYILLYEETKDKRYLEWLKKEAYITDDINTYDKKVQVNGVQHVYTWLARALAQLQYAELVQPNERGKFANATEEVLRRTQGPYLSITGSITGTPRWGELWDATQSGLGKWGETCASAYLMRLAAKAQQQTMDCRWGDLFEQVMYNAFFSAQSSDGLKYRYWTPFNERAPWFDRDTYCCPNNYKREVFEIPDAMFYRMQDGLAINLYSAAQLKAEEMKVVVDTKYPDAEKVVIKIAMKERKLKLRIPHWCEGATVKVGNEAALDAKAGWFEIQRDFTQETTIELNLPMPIRLVEGTRAQEGRVAVMRGPCVYALAISDGKKAHLDVDVWNLVTSKSLVWHPERKTIEATFRSRNRKREIRQMELIRYCSDVHDRTYFDVDNL